MREYNCRGAVLYWQGITESPEFVSSAFFDEMLHAHCSSISSPRRNDIAVWRSTDERTPYHILHSGIVRNASATRVQSKLGPERPIRTAHIDEIPTMLCIPDANLLLEFYRKL